MMNYNVSDFAKKLGVSVKTLQRWDRNGNLKAYRTSTNRRYYTDEQYERFNGNNSMRDKIVVVLNSNFSDKEKLERIQNIVQESEV